MSSSPRLRNCESTPAPFERFEFHDMAGLDFEKLRDVVDGRCAGVIFRSVIAADTCRLVSDNFRRHPGRYVRGADAPATYVGVYHYAKDLEFYLTQALETNAQLDRLFEGTENLWSSFTNWAADGFRGDGTKYRIAEFEGRHAARFVMRTWAGTGNYALLPHEDEAQCHDPRQTGFEIQQAAANPIVAVNICLDNAADADLHYWNLIPDEASRNGLGLTYTGSPYPQSMLNDLDMQEIKIGVGDIYCFNGKAIHAVGRPRDTSGTRSTISFLMARRDERTVIHWS
ncbi:hypothetical protein [Burkholderia gladioli]|uniref:Fe2OG dioxygenase domain-containing protein n=1 Tax=Burkholderia gladioli (strain BSR3) TaxID=999541 RepID=F2LT89_BURGS|nr:hypothetical protein [Burkholderia gladioli]AEA66035.1 hypothetical protein bgla_4p2760 [Burkholderia gladioli BSR3]MBW5285068.1 hypothetical protein [Burkholderia gladioli]